MTSRTGNDGAGQDNDVIAVLLCKRLAQLLEGILRILQLERAPAVARGRHDHEADVTAEHRFLMARRGADPVTMRGDEFLQAGLLYRGAAFIDGTDSALRDVYADDIEAARSHARQHAGSQL